MTWFNNFYLHDYIYQPELSNCLHCNKENSPVFEPFLSHLCDDCRSEYKISETTEMNDKSKKKLGITEKEVLMVTGWGPMRNTVTKWVGFNASADIVVNVFPDFIVEKTLKKSKRKAEKTKTKKKSSKRSKKN